MSISGQLVTHIMEIWTAKFDETFHELKNPFTKRWNPRAVGTLVDGIHDKVDWMLIWKHEHLFQAICQNVVTELSRATVVGRIKV